MLSWVENEKSFITSGPAYQSDCLSLACQNNPAVLVFCRLFKSVILGDSYVVIFFTQAHMGGEPKVSSISLTAIFTAVMTSFFLFVIQNVRWGVHSKGNSKMYPQVIFSKNNVYSCKLHFQLYKKGFKGVSIASCISTMDEGGERVQERNCPTGLLPSRFLVMTSS